MKIEPVQNQVKYRRDNLNSKGTGELVNYRYQFYKSVQYDKFLRGEDLEKISQMIKDKKSLLKVRRLIVEEITHPSDIRYLLELDDIKFERAIKHFREYGWNWIKIAVLDEPKYQKAMELSDMGIDFTCIYAFANLSEENLKKALEIYKREDRPKRELLQLCEDDGLNRDIALKCFEAGLSCKLSKVIGKIFNTKPEEMSVNEKFEMMKELNQIGYREIMQLKTMDIDVLGIIENIERESNIFKKIIAVPKDKQIEFFKNILSNEKEVEEKLISMDFDKYKYSGLPLKYTRKDFIEKIDDILKDTKTETKEEILKHFNIQRTKKGFEGILNCEKLNTLNKEAIPKASKVSEEIKKLTIDNFVIADNEEESRILTSLVQGLPEFSTCVGKLQHRTHDSTIDIHTLNVLKSALKHPKYKGLSDNSKFILKMSILLHDLAKREGEIDHEHETRGAINAVSILSRYSIPEDTKRRIVNTVNCHSWYKNLCNNMLTYKKVACLARYPEDIDIFEIMSSSDIKNINENFINDNLRIGSESELDEKISQQTKVIKKYLKNLQDSSIFIYNSTLINPEKIPTVNFEMEGKPVNIRMLNFNKIKENEELSKFGFIQGTTKSNLKLMVHMLGNDYDELVNTKNLLSNPLNNALLSVSLISPSKRQTHNNYKYGLIVSANNVDIAQASKDNISSGYKKGMQNFIESIFYTRNRYREEFKIKLCEKLNINSDEYAELSKILLNKKYLAQIKSPINLNKKMITKEELINAEEEILTEFLVTYPELNNEITVLNPKIVALIAKSSSQYSLDPDFIRFAKENNLPLIIFPDN